MSWLRFFQRKRADAELMEEIESYLAEETAENRSRGMGEEEARRLARIKFGSPVAVRESLWRQNTISLLDNLLRDFRYASRTLWRTPSFTLIAVGVMALCIGATTSLFTVVWSVLLRPLPFRDPHQLVMVYEHFHDPSMNSEGFNYNTVAPADYLAWRAQTHGFEDMAVWGYTQFNLTGERGELPEIVSARAGSWNLFPLLGVNAAIGRTFTETEDRPDGTVAMLTWSLFERRFGGDPSIVGKQIHLDGKPYTVVGVLPKWFAYPDAKAQVWVPYESGLTPEILSHHDYHFSYVVARLRPNVSLATALGQVRAVQHRLHMENLNLPVAGDVASRTLNQDLGQSVATPLVVLLCAACCLLLIGCLNVANLMVARSAARQKEFAIRSALGAQKIVLIRGHLMESLLVCVAGGVAGVLLSVMATRWLVAEWKDLPSAQSIQPDGVVLGFACALVFAAALLAGLLSAISSTGRDTMGGLQASQRGAAGSQPRTTLRKTLLTVEIATTVVLLIGAGLLLKSFWMLWTTDLGCTTDHVLTMGYSLPAQKYDTRTKINLFNEAVLARVSAMPGVRAAGLGSNVPGGGAGGDDVFTISEHPPVDPGAARPDAQIRSADLGYFNALQIPLLSGRLFTSDDRAGRPRTVIINRQLARQYFPGEDPVGKHLQVDAMNHAVFQIVGVVGDTLYQVGKPASPTMYFSVLDDIQQRGFTLVMRTASDPLTFSVPVQKQIAALDPQLPVSDVLTMEELIGKSLGGQRFSATVVLAFAMLSLLLACIGLYGVLSYLTNQRTGEIGIRVALGAQRGQVLRQMLGDGLRPAFYGLALGIAASSLSLRLLKSMLFETRTLDPMIFAIVPATVLAVASVACLVPAWKASRIDPMHALRSE